MPAHLSLHVRHPQSSRSPGLGAGKAKPGLGRAEHTPYPKIPTHGMPVKHTLGSYPLSPPTLLLQHGEHTLTCMLHGEAGRTLQSMGSACSFPSPPPAMHSLPSHMEAPPCTCSISQASLSSLLSKWEKEASLSRETKLQHSSLLLGKAKTF